ncbi:MAG: CBS domain-containing protein [bacterium]|nr:CBS domain-containing protein [bacterium]
MRPIVAKDLMSSDVMTVREDLPVRELASFFLDNEITGAPVEGSEGTVVGVVSLVDVARADSERTERDWSAYGNDYYDRAREAGPSEDGIRIFRMSDDRLRVRDIMNNQLLSVGLEAPVSKIASLMLRNHIHRMLVIEDNELVGVVSTTDLLGLLVEED